MKWVGQHIYDLIARFRGDVYLEGLSTTTRTDALVVDSNGKISKNPSIGGDITSVGTLSSLAVTGASDLGSTWVGITAQDADQIGVRIAASNTTADVLSLACSTLTTGSAMFFNIDDSLTTATTKSLINIDFDKSGIAGDGIENITTGLNINMADAATNHANATVNMIGAQIDIDSANAQGTITQKGLVLNVAADGVGDTATTSGIEMKVADGGTDIKMMSHADTGDYCTIATTTNGATTITTVDDDGETAHFEIAADGDITLDSAAQIKLEPATGNNILLDGTVTVDGGSVTGLTRLGLDSVNISAVQTSAESFSDDDTSIMTSAAVNDRFSPIAGGTDIVTVGTITTGTWSGTAVAANRQKHLMHYFFKGYGTGDGTNYEIPVLLTDNQAPWEHNTSAGSDGLTALTVQTQMRMGGTVMPQACTLKKWTGWTTCSGTSGTAYIGLFKLTPTANDNSDVSLVLLDAISYTPLGNAKSVAIAETSFTASAIAAGDILVTGIKAPSSAIAYFTSTIEVEF